MCVCVRERENFKVLNIELYVLYILNMHIKFHSN